MPKTDKERRMSQFPAPSEGAGAAGPGPKLRAIADGFLHWCEGCDEPHAIPVPRWNYNGDIENPTFTPSVKITWGRGDRAPLVCHYNITNGSIFYHGDTTHKFAGQTLPLRVARAED